MMTDTTHEPLISLIAGIEIEAIVGGALMRIHLVAGTNPANAANVLRGLDPTCVFRDSFPVRGGGAGRPTLAARALVITIDSRGDSVFIKITAHADDGDDISCNVPKKKTADFVPSLEALGKLSEKSLTKLKTGIDTKKSITVILSETETFTVRYWKSDDQSFYLDSVEA